MLTIIPDKNDLLLNRRSYFNQLRFIRTKAPLRQILVVLLVDKFQPVWWRFYGEFGAAEP